MAVILAFGSAAVFALGIVLQQRVVMDAPEAKEASAGLLFRLIQHPVWLGGIAAYGIAFGMQGEMSSRPLWSPQASPSSWCWRIPQVAARTRRLASGSSPGRW
jgi:protein-S-isoprenylcysteine O-methyltransferase Ste14